MKEPGSRYTYQYNCDPRAVVHLLAANEDFKGRVHTLSDPYCEVIRLINIDYNVIVVHKGHHGSTTERRFIEQAIQDSVWANDTPAAPVLYRITLKRLTENEVATQWCHLMMSSGDVSDVICVLRVDSHLTRSYSFVITFLATFKVHPAWLSSHGFCIF